jgi:hypothetical protein
MFNKNFDIEALKIESSDVPAPPEAGIQTVRPQRSRKGQSPDEHFVGCPVWWLLRVLPVVESKTQLTVALYLWRRRIVCGNHKTFGVPNGELKSWGVSRKVKYRTLDRLAAAGMIRVNRKGKEAHTVTILLENPGVRQ